MTTKTDPKPTDAQLAAALDEVNANPQLAAYLRTAGITIEQFAHHDTDAKRAARTAARSLNR